MYSSTEWSGAGDGAAWAGAAEGLLFLFSARSSWEESARAPPRRRPPAYTPNPRLSSACAEGRNSPRSLARSLDLNGPVHSRDSKLEKEPKPTHSPPHSQPIAIFRPGDAGWPLVPLAPHLQVIRPLPRITVRYGTYCMILQPRYSVGRGFSPMKNHATQPVFFLYY